MVGSHGINKNSVAYTLLYPTFKSASVVMFAGVVSGLLAGCTGNALPEWTSSAEVVVQSPAGGLIYTATATDADGDTVTYGTASTLPLGWTFDSSTGELFIPAYTEPKIPENIQLDLAAYDGQGGATLLQLSVNFDWPLQSSALNITFPPNNSSINLLEGEPVTVLFNGLLNAASDADSAIASVTLTAAETVLSLTLGGDGYTWQGDFNLPSGAISITGEVAYTNGDAYPVNDYVLNVNRFTLEGQSSEGQLQAGHQLDIAARKLYYMQGSTVYTRNLDTGVTAPLWQTDENTISYFGVSKNQETLYLLQQQSTPFNYSEILYAFGGLAISGESTSAIPPNSPSVPFSPSGVPEDNLRVNLGWTLTTVNLTEGSKTHVELTEISETLNLGFFTAEFNNNKNSFIINLYGVGGGASVIDVGTPTAGEPVPSSSFFEITNIVLDFDVETLAATLLYFNDPDGLSGTEDFYFSDAEDQKVFQFNFYEQELFIKSSESGVLVEDYSVNGFSLWQGASDVDYIAQENDFGKLIVGIAGLADSGVEGGYVYGDIVEFTQGSQYRAITACDTQALLTLPVVTHFVAAYPKTCINGVPYDITVDTRANIAYLSAINVVLPESAVLVEENTFSAPPYFYRNIHAVSLQTGEVSTVFSGY